jgi:hypothetical protein
MIYLGVMLSMPPELSVRPVTLTTAPQPDHQRAATEVPRASRKPRLLGFSGLVAGISQA